MGKSQPNASDARQRLSAAIVCSVIVVATSLLALSARLVGYPRDVIGVHLICILSLIVLVYMYERIRARGGVWVQDAGELPRVAPLIRSRFKWLFIILCMTFVLASAFLFTQPGLPNDGIPLFQATEPFFLNNHSRLTRVSKLRYLVVGIGFNVAVLAFQLGCVLELLNVALFGKSLLGRRPPRVEQPGTT